MSINIDTIQDINSYGLDCKNRELYLHSYICNQDEEPGVEYRMASTFYKNIRLLDTINHNPIIIHMHSIGGNWGDGIAIYDAINACQSYVTIIVYGQAESMSSVILQAADNRIMMPSSYFMCHYGSSHHTGNYLDAQRAASYEKRIADTMIDIYADAILNGRYFNESCTDPTHDKAKNFVKRKLKDGDWYLDANEAVYYGFADDILSSNKFPNIDSLK